MYNAAQRDAAALRKKSTVVPEKTELVNTDWVSAYLLLLPTSRADIVTSFRGGWKTQASDTLEKYHETKPEKGINNLCFPEG